VTGIPILVVDDNPLNAKLTKLLLVKSGYVVETAGDAEAALRLLHTFTPRLILMDLQLPGMDGFELTRRLKGDPATRDVVILALTAYAMKGDERRALESGCDGYIAKPIDTRTLPQIIAGYLTQPESDRGMSRARTPAAVISPSSHGRVLVVDDEQRNRELLVRLLEVAGYDVEAAADGEAALTAVADHSPDVILLDVQMPGLDGFEVCRRVKADPATRLTPVVMVTGLNAREHRIEGINAGADDFLGKPFNADELRARVRSLVRLKRYTNDLETAEAVILSLAMTVEARDPYTDGHCQRLAGYATALGEHLNLAADDLAALYRGGYLHDVGKIGVPDSVLLKPARLTAAEFDVMKQHTIIGERLCGNLRSLRLVRSIVRHHHERLDGKGYPNGLRGDEVPLLAQIVSIADLYDAVTTTRPYRAASSPARACEELRGDVMLGARRADLVEAFIALGRNGRFDRTGIEIPGADSADISRH
jgi:putative two-component system response regulator